MDGEGHWGNGLSFSFRLKNILLVHLRYFVQFIREPRGAEKKKEKKDTLYMSGL